MNLSDYFDASYSLPKSSKLTSVKSVVDSSLLDSFFSDSSVLLFLLIFVSEIISSPFSLMIYLLTS